MIHDERSYAFFSPRRGRDVILILAEALTSLTALIEVLLLKIYSHPSTLERFQV